MSTSITPSPAVQLTSPAPLSDNSRSPYSIIEEYETKLRSVKNGAVFVAGLQKISRFFGICALTWATVVLLGGFASALRLLDFYFISILLLLEAARLSTTQVFSKILAKTLFRERHRPEEFQFKDLQYFWASRLDLVGQVSSCLFAVVGLGLAVARFGSSGRYPFTERDESKKLHSNLSPSLYIFYVLVILNSTTAIACSICRPFFGRSSEVSLMCYHDEVYKTAMNSGIPEADDIDIFDFAFQKLASDHMRNIRPPTIKLHNKDLIRYMYHSPNGVGIACEYLKSGDVNKQIVAANLPGFWVQEPRIEKQVGLFWALQDRLYGAGKVAEAAANSIQHLSKAWAQQERDQHPFLISDPSKKDAQNLVDTLIDLLLHPIRPSLLFQLRALEGCCRSGQVLKHIYNQGDAQHDVLCQQLQNMIAGDGSDAQYLSKPEKLCWKLQSIVRGGTSARQTTKMYAANMLHALLCFKGELVGVAKEKLKEMVQEHIHPAEFMPHTEDGKRPYVWVDERDMLNGLRTSLGLAPYEHWHRVRILRPDGTEEPPDPGYGTEEAPAPSNGTCVPIFMRM